MGKDTSTCVNNRKSCDSQSWLTSHRITESFELEGDHWRPHGPTPCHEPPPGAQSSSQASLTSSVWRDGAWLDVKETRRRRRPRNEYGDGFQPTVRGWCSQAALCHLPNSTPPLPMCTTFPNSVIREHNPKGLPHLAVVEVFESTPGTDGIIFRHLSW